MWWLWLPVVTIGQLHKRHYLWGTSTYMGETSHQIAFFWHEIAVMFPSPGHPTAVDEAWYWPKCLLHSGCPSKQFHSVGATWQAISTCWLAGHINGTMRVLHPAPRHWEAEWSVLHSGKGKALLTLECAAVFMLNSSSCWWGLIRCLSCYICPPLYHFSKLCYN